MPSTLSFSALEEAVELLKASGAGRRRVERLFADLVRRGALNLGRVERRVRRIVEDVRRRGDRALLSARARFDGIARSTPLRIAPGELHRAWEQLAPEMREALKTAAGNIERFARRQMPGEWDIDIAPGASAGQRVRALASVGCYVPGGRHPLPSSLLMTVIPAKVAGVRRIAVACPHPRDEGLAAAALLGVDEVYHAGGAHAVAALAYGTESMPRVDKIVGPGNLYVTAAKRAVSFDCAIDMLAGPTEIVVTSERGAAAEIAADLVAQAEHDPEAVAIFVTTREELAKQVIAETKAQSKENAVAKESLGRNGIVIVAGTVKEAREITNRLAPEHLTVDSAKDLDWVRNAGSVFVGRWSAQPMGDYISGPNHTLPTGGMARVRGGLSVNDFVKLITVQEYSANGIAKLGEKAALLGDAEGLTAHAAAIRMRVKKASGKSRRGREQK
jgi:histidinol dehydrogenase